MSVMTNPIKRYAIAVIFIAAVSACSSHPDNARRGAIIADLPDVALPNTENNIEEISTSDIVDSYLRVLEIAEDKRVRRQIETRLADLEMIRSEDALVEGATTSGLFTAPISMYENLLAEPEEGQNSERLLYQLSKAYALEGREDESSATLTRLIEQYPNTEFAAEGQFRLAERAFSERDYAAAKDHYAAVVGLGESTDYYQNALYMVGWTEFKLNRYTPALTAFTKVLDLLLAGQSNLENLSNTQKNLAEDTLRVSAIAYSYLGGADSIKETMQALGERQYLPTLYESLGSLYESQERYRDAADTYLTFIEEQPLSEEAPSFSIKVLQTYYDGNFPSQIRPAKEDFVSRYGKSSPYWNQAKTETQDMLKPYLNEYLLELASFQYALGQNSQSTESTLTQREAYLQAAEYYSQFLATFPEDPEAPRSAFLVGEAYYSAQAYADAAQAYERVAYSGSNSEYGADAGYNMILALEAQIESLPESTASAISERKIQSSIRYAETYPKDIRALPVLAQASDTLFSDGNTRKAMEIAERIVAWEPPPKQQFIINAWLIIGHGNFDLDNFLDAETAYRQLINILPPTDSRATDIEERLAATLYRQSEQLVSTEQVPQAINKLLAIRDSAPNSDIAATAHFDATNFLIQRKEWQRAATELNNFSTYYPAHALNPKIPAKLALVYQELEQWDNAADALQAMVAYEDDSEVRQQALILSAELYIKSGQKARAAQAYERYVNTYPQPKNIAMEAYYQLAELNAENQIQRNRWLRALVDNAERSDNRAQYLGAWAAKNLAEQTYARFNALTLRLPLRESLKSKRQAMETTLQAYNQVLEFGVAEFTTEASYRIGEIYAELSTAMMESERPPELDALALEQYEILLEEQAFPFEEKAIEIHETNVKRSWSGTYDAGVKNSFTALGRLLPARYNKVESRAEVSLGIH